MSTTPQSTVRLHHRIDGDPTAPALVLGPSLGTTLAMWEPQVEALAAHRRVIRFDTRGHGGSPVPDGPYSVTDLAGDVVALLDDLGVADFDYGGLSLGGAIGQQLALEHPQRVRSLVLCCTAARFLTAEAWRERAARVRAEGTGWLVETTRGRWFTEQFGNESPHTVDRMLRLLHETPPEGYAGCCDALRDFDLRARLGDIKAPTLVVAGEHDPVTPPQVASDLTTAVADAQLLVVPAAAHLANVEQPETVTAAIVSHLERTSR